MLRTACLPAHLPAACRTATPWCPATALENTRWLLRRLQGCRLERCSLALLRTSALGAHCQRAQTQVGCQPGWLGCVNLTIAMTAWAYGASLSLLTRPASITCHPLNMPWLQAAPVCRQGRFVNLWAHAEAAVPRRRHSLLSTPLASKSVLLSLPLTLSLPISPCSGAD